MRPGLSGHGGIGPRPGQRPARAAPPLPRQPEGRHARAVEGPRRTPVNPQDLPPGQANALLQAAQSQEPLYRIGVTLAAQTISAYGQAHALKPGMTLEADVVQERRAVWEWLLEPVLATRARMTPSL
jgi:membrane fusion protein